jgi:hypothetical protein
MLGAAFILLLAGVQADPSAASPDVPPPPTVVAPMVPAAPALPATPPSVADADVREFIAVAARKQAGKAAYGSLGPADKLMVIARGRGDFPEVLGSAGILARQQLMQPPESSVALVRFRRAKDPVMPGPSKLDMDYVAAHKLPLFIVGEWNRAIPMWEVAWTGHHVQYRSIGDVGEIGPWHD